MLLPRFEYRAAKTVREAVTLCTERPGSRYLAGGTDLLPQMRSRRSVSRVVDIKGIAELNEIREAADGSLSIGAAVPMSTVAAYAGVRERFPLLVQCIEEVGAWPLRNRATVAGNVCNASPAADTAVALVALEAKFVAVGAGARRTVKAADFFVGPGKTALLDGELLTQVVLPAAGADFQGSYLRLSRRKGMDLATVGVLVARRQGKEPAWRVALGAVAPVPIRVKEAESRRAREGFDVAAEAAELAAEAWRPITDVRATAEYRREMVRVLVARGLASLKG